MGVPLNRKCTLPGCDRKHYGRGLCGLHWHRQRANGDPSVVARSPNGSGWTSAQGYRFRGAKREHIQVAEKALGSTLPPGAEIHHWNEDKADNRNANLVICPSRAYHALLHVRQRALDASGHADWRKCPFCKRYDDPMRMQRNGRHYRHASCHAAYERRQIVS